MEKYIPTFESFVNESGVYKGVTQITKEVEYSVKYEISKSIWSDITSSEEEFASEIITDLELKSGNVLLLGTDFEVSGETFDGKKIFIEQTGDWYGYGGPGDVEFDEPLVKVNGKKVNVKLIKKEFDSYGWAGDIDLARTDIWAHILKKIK